MFIVLLIISVYNIKQLLKICYYYSNYQPKCLFCFSALKTDVMSAMNHSLW